MEREEDDPVSEVLRDRFSSPPSLSLMPKVLKSSHSLIRRLLISFLVFFSVFNYSSPSSEEKGHRDIRTRGGLHFRLDLQINLLVCCLYNIRGTDVDYGPVVHAFAIVTLNSAFFYVDKRKVESEVALYLLAQLVLSRVIHCLSICKKLAFPMRERKYDSVEEHLEGKYKDWQKKLHPDLVHSKSEKEREYAAGQSARVIDAYRMLSKPLARAIYILKLEGVDIDEEETLSDLDLLSEIMEGKLLKRLPTLRL